MSARPGLCGGHRATGVPTAIISLASHRGVTSTGSVRFGQLGSKVSDECARNLVRMQDEICWSALADDFRSFSRISFPEVSHLHVFGAVSKRNATMHPV